MKTPADDSPAPGTQGAERRGYPSGAVFLGLIVSFCLAAAAAGWIYARYVRFEPVAARHLPQTTAVAVRLDVAQAVVYEPFRRHLLALLEWDCPFTETRLSRIARETSVELGVDLRELVFATDRSGEWIVALGGHFPRTGVVEGLARVLDEEHRPVTVRGVPPRLVHESGVSFTVAADGVLLLASSEENLERALEPRSPPVKFEPGLALELLAQAPTDPEVSSELQGGFLKIHPGETFPTSIDLLVRGEGWTQERAAALLSGRTGDFLLLGPDTHLDVKVEPGSTIVAATRLDRAEFDGVVGRLAASTRTWFE